MPEAACSRENDSPLKDLLRVCIEPLRSRNAVDARVGHQPRDGGQHFFAGDTTVTIDKAHNVPARGSQPHISAAAGANTGVRQNALGDRGTRSESICDENGLVI
jgi:hypothetical protein